MMRFYVWFHDSFWADSKKGRIGCAKIASQPKYAVFSIFVRRVGGALGDGEEALACRWPSFLCSLSAEGAGDSAREDWSTRGQRHGE